jgi:hypothetical protein
MCVCSVSNASVCICVYYLCYDDNGDNDRKTNDKGILISLMLCAVDGNWNSLRTFCCMAMDVKMFALYKIIKITFQWELILQ